MLRRIIQINEDLCNGCGICVDACHEGAIALRNNKAVLTRDDYCDGLGDCLPNCPTGAITFIEKDTLPYDDVAVKANIARKKQEAEEKALRAKQAMEIMEEDACGCPGSRTKVMPKVVSSTVAVHNTVSELTTWPIQLQLVNPKAPFFTGANLLIAADCTAFSYPNFQHDFMRDRVVLIACPKLDQANYIEKLAHIFMVNDIHSITVARMEVPCCGGLVNIVKQALSMSGLNIPLNISVISTTGKVI